VCVSFAGEPSFINVGPSKGPLEGGTTLTIKATPHGDDNPVSLRIGNLTVSIESYKGYFLSFEKNFLEVEERLAGA
jgi:hypothetical protein